MTLGDPASGIPAGTPFERGVTHRDLKPENVMVGAFGETQVLDWGLAKIKDHDEEPGDGVRERKGLLLGTPLYMSPEQASGRDEEIDERSDVWSLGVTSSMSTPMER